MYFSYDFKQSHEADRRAVMQGTPARVFMERAGLALADTVEAAMNAVEADEALFVCGGGNNGGDGYALASILADCGHSVEIFRVSPKFSGDGSYYHNLALSKGVPSSMFSSMQDLSGYDIVVDCIFGTGFCGVPNGLAAEAITAINRSGAFVVSVDINSGMNGDSGEGELAVKSDLTVSIGFYKTGMFCGRAGELIGKLVNADIGIVLSE